MRPVNSRGLPPCLLSKHCFRLLDELDEPHQLARNAVNYLLDHDRDEQLLAELRIHVPQCSTCTATLTVARQQREQQRSSIQKVLGEGEQCVPTTTARIMDVIRRASHMQARSSQDPSRQIEQVPRRSYVQGEWDISVD
ncbi:MAG: hypothetical protein ACJ788_23070 [Ktedonobacteraceae bacterium]